MIIDRSYFVGELNIPNKDAVGTRDLLDQFIEKYEDIFLRELLGYELFKEFKAGTTTLPYDARWTDLIEGKEYTDRAGRTRYYPGLTVNLSGPVTLEISPIACYVYYWYIRNNHSQTAAMGEVKSKTENAMAHNPGLKMTRAWNEMSGWVCEFRDYLDAYKTTYPLWEKQDVWCMLRSFRPINEFNI
jgi:hypothetical protein